VQWPVEEYLFAATALIGRILCRPKLQARASKSLSSANEANRNKHALNCDQSPARPDFCDNSEQLASCSTICLPRERLDQEHDEQGPALHFITPTMLQPRIPLRRVQQYCQVLSSTFRRSYAQVIETPGLNAIAEEPTRFGVAATSAPRDEHVRGELALRRYKPRTPGIRHLVRPINDHLWKGRPWFKLTYPKKGQSRGGRNNSGRITVRHRGAGHKRRIRTLDFDRSAPGEHYVERIEHDPGRTAHIALVTNKSTQEKSYILAAEGMREGDTVQSYRSGIPQQLLDSMGGTIDQGVLASRTAWRGNCLPLGMIPIGTSIFNIAVEKDGPAKYCRSAGTHGIIVGKGEDTVQKELIKTIEEGGQLDLSKLSDEQMRKFEKAAKFVTVRLSSGEVRLVASNVNYQYTSLGKAGRKRWLGWRPTVRGLAMNANEHPHGGGRGKSKGNVHPVSPWGTPVRTQSLV
jgi:ribosomal protein L2